MTILKSLAQFFKNTNDDIAPLTSDNSHIFSISLEGSSYQELTVLHNSSKGRLVPTNQLFIILQGDGGGEVCTMKPSFLPLCTTHSPNHKNGKWLGMRHKVHWSIILKIYLITRLDPAWISMLLCCSVVRAYASVQKLWVQHPVETPTSITPIVLLELKMFGSTVWKCPNATIFSSYYNNA